MHLVFKGLALILQILLILLIASIGSSIFVSTWPYYQAMEGGFFAHRSGPEPWWYVWGFYAHISSSFMALILGLGLFSGPRWSFLHRWSGRIYAILVLFFAAPSGFLMGLGTAGGWLLRLNFILLSSLWTGFTYAAWRAVRQGDFQQHGLWAQRGFALATSAIWLRLFSFLGAYFFAWRGLNYYTFYSILSWVLPLVLLWFWQHFRSKIN